MVYCYMHFFEKLAKLIEINIYLKLQVKLRYTSIICLKISNKILNIIRDHYH